MLRTLLNSLKSLTPRKAKPPLAALAAPAMKLPPRPVSKHQPRAEMIRCTTPKGWHRLRNPEADDIVVLGPIDPSGWRPEIYVGFLVSNQDLESELDIAVSEHQKKDGYKLVHSSVVTHSKGAKALALEFTYILRLVEVTQRQLMFPVGYRTLVVATASAPTQLWTKHLDSINGILGSLRATEEAAILG
jgi:hypothetical protein